jgi:hypothetical protein
MQINYTAPQHVADVVAGLGRTEDVRFSPNNRRLAIAGFKKNEIVVFDIEITPSPDGPKIMLTDTAKISSTYLNCPHGLDFIDDETIIVANREANAGIFKLPQGSSNSHDLTPVAVIGADVLHSPGSVSVTRKHQGVYEILICNNYGHTVTRHLLDFCAGCSIKSAVLLRKWLDIPDGVSVSRDTQWIAISNHNTHSVLLYKNTPSLNETSNPDGILRCVYYPHGLRFSSDDRFILVADAGAPYVHIFGKDGPSWRGVRNPLASIRVLNDEDYLRGRYNPEEGGPKGIDIDNGMKVLVTTCEFQPIAFFDLKAVLRSTCFSREETVCTHYERNDQSAFEIEYELAMVNQTKTRIDQADARAKNAEARVYEAEARANQAETRIAAVTNSRSWRLTAPLRWLVFILRNFRSLPKRVLLTRW